MSRWVMPEGVRFLQGIGNLNPVLKHLLERQGAHASADPERLALEVLHDEVRGAVLFAHVIEARKCADESS